MECDFILPVKGFAAMVEKNIFELFISDACLLRRSSMSTGSILAAVEH